jgi:hypothetical protein
MLNFLFKLEDARSHLSLIFFFVFDIFQANDLAEFCALILLRVSNRQELK